MHDIATWQLLRPHWLWLALPIALLLVALVRQQRRASRWRDVIDASLLPYLLERNTVRASTGPFALAALGWTLAVLCLAGPSCSRQPTPVQQRQDALLIVLDLSLSMYASDVLPSRLVRAKRAISDLLARRKDGRTALIVYAGDAHVVTPLTDDVRAIENLLPQLEPSIMPVPGSNIADALGLTRRLMDNAGAARARVLVITDEIANIADVVSAERKGMTISVLGIGTADGAPIPLDFAGRAGELLKDGQGATVIARLDAAQLAEVARVGGGRYRTAQPTTDDTDVVLGRGDHDVAAANAASSAPLTIELRSDDGYWLLLLIAPLAALAFRRGVITGVALTCLVLGTPRPATALTWRDLWQRPDQQGIAALHDGEPDRAATLFTTTTPTSPPFTTAQWRATALYRGSHYAEAARVFSTDKTADGYYNRGNALVRAGDLQSALAAYDRALAIAPKHADAAFNRDLVKRLEKQKAAQPQSGAQQRNNGARSTAQSSPNSAQNQPASTQAQGNTRPQGTPPQSPSPERTRSGHAPPAPPTSENPRELPTAKSTGPAHRHAMSQAERAAQEKQEEKQRANEQWLRRVPDDPGGLLRRKFNSESGERFLERRGAPTTDKIW